MVMRTGTPPRDGPLIPGTTPPRLREESDTVLIVLAITVALLVELAVYAFMATH